MTFIRQPKDGAAKDDKAPADIGIASLPRIDDNPYRQLHKFFADEVSKTNSVCKILNEFIVRRFLDSGIKLSTTDRNTIRDLCRRIEAGEPPELITHLKVASAKDIAVDLTPREGELDAIFERRAKAAADGISDVALLFSKKYYKTFTHWADDASQVHDAQLSAFRGRIARTWRKPFQALSAFLLANTQLGEDFMKELTIEMGPGRKYTPKVSALFLLHARACIVAAEVQTLLKHGFPDGGIAWWRTLHEISVVAKFIAKQDEVIAERYAAYEDIESYRAASSYQEFQSVLGQVPLTKSMLAKLERRKNNLIKIYGSVFANEYGWASPAFNDKAPKFSSIEDSVGMDHLRPYYKLASQQTHATAKGALFRMGLTGTRQQHGKELLLVGPTNTGFTEPAQLTSYSLLQVTVALLMQKPMIDRLVTCNVLTKMQEKIPSLFWKVQSEILQREMALKES